MDEVLRIFVLGIEWFALWLERSPLHIAWPVLFVVLFQVFLSIVHLFRYARGMLLRVACDYPMVFPEPIAQLPTTLEQATAAAGLPEDLAGRLYDAWELPRPQPGQALRADEDELLQLSASALAAFGRDETSLLAMHRQLGESLRRLAESQVRLFHTHVEQQLGAEGEPDRAWTDDLNQVAAG